MKFDEYLKQTKTNLSKAEVELKAAQAELDRAEHSVKLALDAKCCASALVKKTEMEVHFACIVQDKSTDHMFMFRVRSLLDPLDKMSAFHALFLQSEGMISLHGREIRLTPKGEGVVAVLRKLDPDPLDGVQPW